MTADATLAELRLTLAAAVAALCWAAALSAEELLLSRPAEIAAAVKKARPGDHLVLRDGTWSDADILFDAQGTAARPITLRAETPGRVILRGKSRLRIAGRHLVVAGLWFKDGEVASDAVVAFRRSSSQHAHHCRLTNCAITANHPLDRDDDTKWISLYGSYNRVDHCYLAGKENAGATLVVWLSETPNHHRIDHNHFGPRPRLGSNGGETIRVGTSDWSLHNSRTVVEHNLFEQCNGEVEIISSKSCENIFRHNTFLECEGALTLRHGNRCTVEGNFFLGQGQPRTGGVRVIGEDHKVYNNYFAGLRGEGARAAICLMNGLPDSPLHGYFQVQRATVAFNTVIDCREDLVLGYVSDNPKGGVLPPKDCLFANNVIVGEHGPLVRTISEPENLRWENNLFHGAAVGLAPLAGIRQVDPQMERAAGGLWRPAAGSPVRGAARGDFPFVRDDIDGQPRGAARDLGCDQRSCEPALRRPLTPADVGPSWKMAS